MRDQPSRFAAVAAAAGDARGLLLFGLATIVLAAIFAIFHALRPAPAVPPDSLADADLRCLAQAIYFEARGEPFEGRMAVAQVVLNRLKNPRYPANICDVVFQGSQRRHACQFSFACDGRSDQPRDQLAWQASLKLASLAVAGNLRDITGQATHYHADYVRPLWARALLQTAVIGRHRFYSGEDADRRR